MKSLTMSFLCCTLVLATDFWRLRDSAIKGGYYAGERIGGGAAARYEIGNRRYAGNLEIEALLRSVDRGAGVHVGLLCCPTLVSGDEIDSVDEAVKRPNPDVPKTYRAVVGQ